MAFRRKTNRLSSRRERNQLKRRRLRVELLEDRRLLAGNVAKVADTSDTFDWFFERAQIPFPNRAVVQLTTVFDSNRDGKISPNHVDSGGDYMGGCSGAVIDSNHVLTAAHCVYNVEDDRGWGDWVFVHPARNGEYERPFGEVAVTRMVVPSAWTNPETSSGDHDFAILTLDRNIGSFTGSFGYGTLSNTDLQGRDLKVIHYPGETTAPDGQRFPQNEQYVSSGPVYRADVGGTFTMDFSQAWWTGGSSGAPFFVEDAVINGHVFRNTIVGVNHAADSCKGYSTCVGERFPFNFDWSLKDGVEEGFVAKIASSESNLVQSKSGLYYDHTTVDRPMLANAHKWLGVSPDDPQPAAMSSQERQDWEDRIGRYDVGTVTNDETFTIRVPVWNGGTATASRVRVDFYLARNVENSTTFDKTTKLGTAYVSSISPFQTRDATLTTRLPDSVRPGSYKIYSVIDPYNSVPEKGTRLNDLSGETRHRHYGRQDIRVVRTAPSIDAGGPYYVAAGDTIGLNGSLSSYTGNASRLQYKWQLDADGVYGETGTSAAQGDETGRSPNYLALEASNGSQRVLNFQAATPFGSTAYDSATVTIDNSLAFETLDAGIPALANADLAFADFDRDGDEDLAVSGIDSTGLVLNDIYLNVGGEFSASNAGLQSTSTAFSSWVDFDNDGDLDLYQSGNSAVLSALYRNDSGVFSEVLTALPQVRSSAVAWADFDTDGDFDVAISGIDASGARVTRLFENQGGSFIESFAGTFIAVSNGSLAWADFDRDGRQDLLLTGQSDTGPVTDLYRNTLSGFASLSSVLPNTSDGEVKWGDFDNDGYPDVAIAGSTLQGPNAAIYRNNGDSTFSFRTALPAVTGASLDWGDFDNDGDRDLVLLGTGADGSHITELFQNRAGSFYSYQAGLMAISDGDAKFVDANSDGNLDVISVGANADSEAVEGAYLNQFSTTNNPPRVANAVVSYESDGTVVLSWDGLDNESPETGLSYNLRLGTTPEGSEVVALGSGRDGNIGAEKSYRAEGLARGQTYYWSVEAIDPSGQVATSQELTFGAYFEAATSYSVAGVFDGDAKWADFNNDGNLDLIVVGEGTAGAKTAVYENTGVGLQEVATSLPDLANGAVDIGDFDNDGRVDLLLTGRGFSGPFSAVYRNSTDGFELHTTLIGVESSDAAWIDIDNDGDLDVAIAGATEDGTETFGVYQNSDGAFQSIATSVPGFSDVSFDWQDIDNDGWIDLAIGGSSNGENPLLVFRNLHGELVEQADLGDFSSVSLAWVDADLDGYSDLLVAGEFRSYFPYAVIFSDVSETIYPQQQYLISSLRDPSVGWVDFDNDGDADILLNGLTGTTPMTTFFANNTSGGPFTSQPIEQAIDLPNLSQGGFQWADVDGDGDLDALAFGLDETLNPIADVYINQLQAGNAGPSAPVGLVASPYSADSVTLSWDLPTDAETSEYGLSYALQVGTTSGGIEVASPLSIGPARQISGPAALRRNESNTLTGLEWGQTYYWSAQTIDSSWTASELSMEDSFLFNNTPTAPTLLSASIPENNTAGEAITKILSSDQDLVSGDSLTFSLVAGEGDDDNALFSLQGDQLIALPSFNYEQRSEYSVRIRVGDSLGAQSDSALSIEVLDVNDVPRNILLSGTTVPENAPNFVVGLLTPLDDDASQTHTFTIANDPDDVFEIQGDELRIQDSKLLDYESASQHSVTILVTDSGTPAGSVTRTFSVEVTDVNEVGLSMLGDLNDTTYSSNPKNLVLHKGAIYFTADRSGHSGRGNLRQSLWRYAPDTGVVTHVSDAESVGDLVSVGERLFFSGNLNSENGLFSLNTTTGSTTEAYSARAASAVVLQDSLYFSARTPGNGIELVRLDLSTDDTEIIDINPNAAHSYVRDLVTGSGKLYFIANSNNQWGIFSYDPILSENSRLVLERPLADVAAGLTYLNEKLYFGYRYNEQPGLWSFDTVSKELTQVSNISQVDGFLNQDSVTGKAITAFDGRLYFGGTDGSMRALYEFAPASGVSTSISGTEGAEINDLWVGQDGVHFALGSTATGIEVGSYKPGQLAAEIIEVIPTGESSAPIDFVEVDGNLYFSATDEYVGGNAGREIWKLDGNNVASLAADVDKRTYPSSPSSFEYNGELYFFTSDGRGIERGLWKLDVQTQTPQQLDFVDDLAVNSVIAAGGSLYGLGVLGGVRGLIKYEVSTNAATLFPLIFGSDKPVMHGDSLYFEAFDSTIGWELYQFDIPSETGQFIDIDPGSDSSRPDDFTVFDDQVYFAASQVTPGGDGKFGPLPDRVERELWSFDPVSGQATLADDVNNDPNESSLPAKLLSLGDKLIFEASSTNFFGDELWSFDPATGDSSRLTTGNLNISSDLLSFQGAIYYGGRSGTGSSRVVGVHRIDLADGSVHLLPGTEGSLGTFLMEHNGSLYFRHGSEATGGEEFAKFDPQLGAATIIDALPGPAYAGFGSPISFGGNLYFTSGYGYDNPAGGELYALIENPIAINDFIATEEDKAATFDVFANDRDPNEDELLLEQVSTPSHGVAEIIDGSILRYSPTGDFFGSDSFSYTVNDGNGNEATATVFVSVLPVNDQPTFVGSGLPPTQEDSGATTMAGWAAFDAGAANEGSQTTVSYIVSDVTNSGLFQVAPSISPDGLLSYKAAPNQNGSSTFVVRVRDDGGVENGGADLSAPQTFTITVEPVNDAPVINFPSSLVAATEITEPVVGNSIQDIDVQPAGTGELAATASVSNGILVITQLTGLTFVNGGNAQSAWTIRGAIDDVNAALASLNYKSNPGFFGTDSIEVQVDDLGNVGTGGALTDSGAINVTVLPRVAVPVGETATEILRDGDDLVVRKDSVNEYFRAPLVDVSGVVVNGQMDSESITITVDGLTGDELPLGIRVIGGEGIGDNDDLVLQGSQTITNHEYTTGGPESGVIVLDGLTVFFSEFEPIYDYLDSRSRRFVVGTSGDQTIVLEDDGDSANGRVRLHPGDEGGFERIEFYVPTEGLTIVGNEDNNEITVGELEPLDNLAIVVLADAGDDTVDASNYVGTIQIAGGLGDDQIMGGQGVNLIDGGDGNDTVQDGGGENLVSGGSGVNRFVPGGGLNVFESGESVELGGFSDSYTTDEDTTLTVAALDGILANDSVPFNESVSIEIVAAPAFGAVEVDALGGFVYTPNENANGVDTFTYRISDADSSSSEIPVTIAIHSVNDLPTANDDLIWVAEDGSRKVLWSDLLQNDFDEDNDALTPQVSEFPLHGQLIEFSDGTIEYIPEAEFFGIDTFKYSVTDPFGSSLTASVIVSVSSVEDAPVVTLADHPSSVDEGSTVTASGTFSDADPDSQLQLAANIGEVFETGDGTWGWTYSPTDDFIELQQVVISVWDGVTASTTAFDLEVNNVAVSFDAGLHATLSPSQEGSFERLDIAFIDPGLDEWEGTVDYGDGSPLQTLELDPEKKSFNLSHVFTTEDVFTVTVKLKDDDSDFVTRQFDVNVLFNQPPVASEDILTLSEDETATILNGSLGEENTGLLGNDVDPDGDDVTIVAVDDSNINRGILLLDDGLVSFDPNGEFDWLALDESSSMNFAYTIADPSGETSTASATIVIQGANDAPVVSVNQLLVSIDEGKEAANRGGFSDVDVSDDLQFNASIGDVTGLSDGTWTWSWDSQDGPDDSQLVTIGISDGKALRSIEFHLDIDNVAPSPSLDSVSSVRIEGAQIDVLASATDPAGANDTLTYSYEVIKEGVAFASGGGVDQTLFSFTPDDNGSYEITLSVTDEDGGTTSVRETITVGNALPQISLVTTDSPLLTSPAADATVALTGAFSESGSLDTHQVVVDWGDGSSSAATVDQAARTFDAEHEYASGGFFQITVTLTDNDGGEGTGTTTAAVQGVGLVGDTLWVVGTDEKDKVKIARKTRGRGNRRGEYIDVDARLYRDRFKPEFDAGLVSSIRIVTLGGKDDIDVKRDVELPVTIKSGSGDDKVDVHSGQAIVYAGLGDDKVETADGNDFVDGGEGDDDIETGDGNDVIVALFGDNRIKAGDGDDVVTVGDGRDNVHLGKGHDVAWLGGGDDRADGDDGDDVIFGQTGDDRIDGDRGNDIIVGGEGDDRIDGGRGLDVLIGGFGADRIDGGRDDDLLIAGWTNYDNDLEFLQRILIEWSSEQDDDLRVENLRTGGGATLSGTRLVAGESVFDDGAKDRLDGDSGRDWFFGSLEDEIKRKRANELLDLL